MRLNSRTLYHWSLFMTLYLDCCGTQAKTTLSACNHILTTGKHKSSQVCTDPSTSCANFKLIVKMALIYACCGSAGDKYPIPPRTGERLEIRATSFLRVKLALILLCPCPGFSGLCPEGADTEIHGKGHLSMCHVHAQVCFRGPVSALKTTL